MAWMEEESNVKFLCWGSLKEGLSKDTGFVVTMGKPIEADIVDLKTIEKKDKAGDTVCDYKYRLRIKGEDKEILMWSNASIKRQQENFDLVVGDHIEFTYVKDYDTSFGQKGRQIRIRVKR